MPIRIVGKEAHCIFLIGRNIFKEVENMKIRYSPEANVLVIELKKGILNDSIDLKEGIILHLNKKREPLEIEILDATKVTSLEEISMFNPIRRLVKETKV